MLDGTDVGEVGVVSAGSVVTPRKKVEPGMLVGGVPAQPIKPVSEKVREGFKAGKKMYEELAQKYLSLDFE